MVFICRDLEGLSAVDIEGLAIGEVVSVQNFGAGVLLEIRLAGTNRTEFLPFNDDCVLEVSLEDKRITVKPLPGLWD